VKRTDFISGIRDRFESKKKEKKEIPNKMDNKYGDMKRKALRKRSSSRGAQ
jgi:hypothetical protein